MMKKLITTDIGDMHLRYIELLDAYYIPFQEADGTTLLYSSDLLYSTRMKFPIIDDLCPSYSHMNIEELSDYIDLDAIKVLQEKSLLNKGNYKVSLMYEYQLKSDKMVSTDS